MYPLNTGLDFGHTCIWNASQIAPIDFLCSFVSVSVLNFSLFSSSHSNKLVSLSLTLCLSIPNSTTMQSVSLSLSASYDHLLFKMTVVSMLLRRTLFKLLGTFLDYVQ